MASLFWSFIVIAMAQTYKCIIYFSNNFLVQPFINQLKKKKHTVFFAPAWLSSIAKFVNQHRTPFLFKCERIMKIWLQWNRMTWPLRYHLFDRVQSLEMMLYTHKHMHWIWKKAAYALWRNMSVFINKIVTHRNSKSKHSSINAYLVHIY